MLCWRSPAPADGEKTKLLAPPHVRRDGISVLTATAVLGTFSTTSSNVLYPWTYGKLGIGLGPLLGFGLQGVMLLIALLVSRIAVELRCSTFGELGEAIGGRWGGHLLRLTQLWNNVLFLPVALVLSAEALRQVGLISLDCSAAGGRTQSSACDWWACHVNTLLLLIGLAWPVLLLARDIGHLGCVSVVSVVLIVVQTVIIITYVALVEPFGVVVQPYSWFGSR